MYQLSHLLAEQRILFGALYNTSILGDETSFILEIDSSKQLSEEKEEELRKQKLSAVMEKVEGCTDLLDMPNRTLNHEGFLSELDPIENTPIKSVCCFLFSDGVLVASSNSNA